MEFGSKELITALKIERVKEGEGRGRKETFLSLPHSLFPVLALVPFFGVQKLERTAVNRKISYEIAAISGYKKIYLITKSMRAL